MIASAAPLPTQPHAIVERDGVRYTLLGTAHVSRASVDAVRGAIASGALRRRRGRTRRAAPAGADRPDALAKLDLFQVIREGKTGLVAANLALAAYQRRLAEQLGIEPGAELKARRAGARRARPALHLIDRDVGTHASSAPGHARLLGPQQADGGPRRQPVRRREGRRRARSRSSSRATCSNRASANSPSRRPQLYEAVIAERDRYMAARLRESGRRRPREVLAVVGAGHLQGPGAAPARRQRAIRRRPSARNSRTLPKKQRRSLVHRSSLATFAAGRLRLGLLARRRRPGRPTAARLGPDHRRRRRDRLRRSPAAIR